MTLEYLLELVHNYSTEDKELIIRAYEFAKFCHKGVKRKSGDPYIIHPLSVACILAEMHADADTIAAGLLHDVLEDCPTISKEDLAQTFNPTIAKLVDGVSKMKKVDFNNDKVLTAAANTQKLVLGLWQDIRVIVIKIADNLHNMRTEQFQPPHKQIEHANETMGLYAPFARLTGAYKLMSELEDLSFSYLDPEGYKEMDDLIKFVEHEYEEEKEQLLIEVAQMLNSNHIPFNIKSQIKSHYELHRKILTYGSYDNIHDLYGIRILLDNVENCYTVKAELEMMYKYLKEKGKDYIKRPKTNRYRSLHTSIISPNGYNFQFQINTEQMQAINNYGLTAYWNLLSDQNRDVVAQVMQNDFRHFPCFSILKDMASANRTPESYVRELNNDVLVEKVYVYTPNEDVIELPIGSTPIDFAYKIHTDIGNSITGVEVNGQKERLDYKLKNKDVVNILYDPTLLTSPDECPDYSSMCKTEHAKRKIKEFHHSNIPQS